ncbi:MAG TPA: LapA family protein [Desulfovibrio sp.]|jgi:uncharacterized integral membrane protein|uniref:LapA family protein n=1 Tax=Desulfovibrio TaxID=872 RepID=UPI002A3FEF5B|nr:LapA family protein [Desulfovibrio sp.]MDY0305833.1 LapA family protein [Desulfovibrionaceae bacterium]HMM38615.1 LapA family protein [Desulfovibrio sp.]
MRYVKVLLLVLFFAASMLFFVQNKDTVTQSFVLVLSVPLLFDLRSIPLPFYLIVLASFLVGGLVCIGYFLSERFRLAGQVKELRIKASNLERELNQLRNLPLENQPYQTPVDEPEA